MGDERRELEEKVSAMADQVVDGFKEFPSTVPIEITLYNADSHTLDCSKDKLVPALVKSGFKMPVRIGDEERGYSIDVSSYLQYIKREGS